MTEPINEVRFSEPPPARAAKYAWDEIAKRLKRKPGEWAQVYEQDKQTYAVAIRSNKVSALKRENGFESRTANNDNVNKTCSLWVRYAPDKDTRRER